MADSRRFLREIKRNPDRYYILHYSSEGLYDDGLSAYSPRITSIAIIHYESEQMVSFSMHAIAEELRIVKDELEKNYDLIENELLTRFYNFVRDRREKNWVHWQMKNLTYGFEHLAHRYRVLTGAEPPHIPVEVRINLSDVLKDRYGEDFAKAPRMKSLMLMQGALDKRFLDGSQESQCFKNKEFIRLSSSTMSKVEFFRYVISLSLKGKLRTAGRGIGEMIDRLLEGRSSRAVALLAALVGVVVGLYQAWLWLPVGH